MSPKQIKYLDYWLGVPILFSLTLWKNIFSLFSFKNNSKEPRKIIFIKLIEQGATVLAFPAIQKAVDMVGINNVFFLVFDENKPILEIINVIPEENIFTLRNKGPFLFSLDVIKALFKIHRNKIDTAIDMEFFSRFSAILTYLSGAKIRVGNHRYLSELPYRGNLMTHKIQHNPFLHVAIAYLLLVDSVKSSLDDCPLPKINLLDVKITPKQYSSFNFEVENIKNIIMGELKGEFSHPLIIINPNSSDLIPIRKWGAENFILLAKKIIAHFENKMTIAITGNTKEAPEAFDICKRIGSERVINLAGKTDLKELFALYALGDALITNDSGPGHFASMTEIKDIVLFGPETPKLYGPLGKNVFYIKSHLSCSPCVNPFNHRFSPCKNNLCMRSISVETVFNKIIEVLAH